MIPTLALKSLESLPRTPASDMKKLGWRGVMKTIARSGKLLVTNHDEPEAVIIPVAEYNAMLALLRGAAEKEQAGLTELRAQWDEKLAWLQQPDAGERLRDLLRRPTDLGGKAFTGDEF